MADGTTKPIEKVRVGDKVKATDPRTGKTGARTVQALIVGDGSKELVRITVDVDGRRGGRTGSLVATAGHPFWSPDQGRWVDAGQIEAGGRLLAAARTRPRVTGTARLVAERHVYNLTVADLHTYYVVAGDTPVLVHNNNCGDIDDISRSIAEHANRRAAEPGGIDHFVRGVDPRALDHYVDGVINGHVPNVKVRHLNRGRVGYWDPRKGAVVIEEGNSGTVFTPKNGKDYFDHELE